MQDITAYSCAICDPDGGHPRPSMKMLQQHMLEQHSQHLCTICIKVSTGPDTSTALPVSPLHWSTTLTWQATALLAISACTFRAHANSMAT